MTTPKMNDNDMQLLEVYDLMQGEGLDDRIFAQFIVSDTSLFGDRTFEANDSESVVSSTN